MSKFNRVIVLAAIDGFEAQKQRLDQQIAELRGLLNGDADLHVPEQPGIKKRKTMSASARKKIAAAQKKRWAEHHAAKEVVEIIPQKPKRKLSAAGRRNIIAATKKRWAKVRGAAA